MRSRNRPSSLPLLALILLLAVPAAAEGPPARGQGETRTVHVEIEPVRQKVAYEDLQEVDEASREQLQRRWEKLLTHGTHKVGPPLPTPPGFNPAALSPLSPPSTQAATEGLPGSPLTFFENTDLFSILPGGFSATVPEPSTAAAGDRVFYSLNWHAAASADRGASFTPVNPFTGPFAPANSGFCCDQLAVHDPGTDTLIFLQQYIEDGTTGTQRLNIDQGFDGTFDCFYDITPQQFIWGPGDWFDYPDMAVGSNFLYHSSNVFDNFFEGALVARYPLSELAACDPVTIDAYTDTSFFSFKLTQGAGTTMHFADHITLSSIRIWSWTDAAMAPTSVDRNVTAWSNAGRTCPGPDTRDWCGFIDSRLAGAFATPDAVGFLWTPAQGGGFNYPYTRLARFDPSTINLLDETDIWSPDHAYVYSSVAANDRGDVGGTIMWGGGAFFPNCAAFIADDTNGYEFSPLEMSTAASSTTGPGSNRSGDYLSSRMHSTYQDTFVGTCYNYLATNAAHTHFVWFGRERAEPDSSIFYDGFESGDTTRWSTTVN